MSSDYLDKANEITQIMGELINEGNPGKAYDIGWVYMKSLLEEKRSRLSVHFWFQLGLAINLIDPTDLKLELIEKRLENSPDYNDSIGGDWLRDQALGALRLGKIEYALAYIEMAEDKHRDDRNRMAAIDMVKGRIYYKQKNLFKSIFFLKEADKAWSEIGEKADKAWIRDNRFHLLKAMVADRFPQDEIEQLAETIINSDEPNLTRLKRVRLIAKGWSYNVIDDLSERLNYGMFTKLLTARLY